MALDKAAILKAMALKTERIRVEGGEVIMSEISADDYMDAFNNPLSKTDGEYDGTKFTALLVTRCIVNEKGQRVFDDTDIDVIRNGSSRVYTALVKAAQRLNGLSGDETKNSVETE